MRRLKHHRHLTQLPLVGLAVALLTAPSAAQNPEARAKGLMNDAMEKDYLETNFKAAEAKLRTALRVCGEKDCSKGLLAKIHRSLGVVYAGGMNRGTDAIEELKEMIRLDPKLGLDANFTTNEIQEAFDKAKAASGPVVIDREIVVLEEKPWAEQAVGTPIPIYVEAPEGSEVTKVVVRFKGPGDEDWSEITLRKHDAGFAGYIPCRAVGKPGVVKYFATAFDANLDRIASGGSAKEPRVVKLKDAIEGRQPALPDSTPPSACPKDEELLSCETNDDCPGSQVCVDLQCVDESTIEVPENPRAKVKDNWLTLQFSPDLMLVKSTSGVCDPQSQEDGQFSCFFGDGTQFDGAALDTGNSTNGGIGTGSMRVMVGYDRVFMKRLAVGARVGFAFLGHLERTDGDTFFPIHGEARAAFHFSKDPFARAGVRPYIFAGGGVGEFSARVSTEVQQQGGRPGAIDEFTLDVYQSGGTFFAGGGLGLQYAVNERMAMVIEVAGRQTFPKSTTVVAPSLGFTYGL